MSVYIAKGKVLTNMAYFTHKKSQLNSEVLNLH